MNDSIKMATLGAGCFWCVEAVFVELRGVLSVTSGYSGGHVINPTYQQVTTGSTGHAEVTRISYDTRLISFEELLEAFWQTHDPTTLNRQGNDVGTQYRSVIYYHDDDQRKIATHYKKALENSGAFDAPIVTEIAPLKTFYEAEDYHKNYYKLNSSQGYCQYVIAPKMQKFRKAFKEKLKS